MIDLRSMTQEEFMAFSEWSIEHYAEDLILSGKENPEVAAKQSSAEFYDILPDGLATPLAHLLIIQDDRLNFVGKIWYQIFLPDDRTAFICDFLIEEQYRGKGYGQAALEKIETDARTKGCEKIALNVFMFNTPAFQLYQKCGYRIVKQHDENCIMEKEL